MARIIDDVKNEAVGRIEDTGSYSTNDDLLEKYLERYVDEGIATLVPEHTDTGINYRTGTVECGQKGFAKAVLQHLPSPYTGETEEMMDLDDYSIEEEKAEDIPPIRGKQGGMNTMNRFTSLASESSDATRQRVDAEWNDVMNEEELPELAQEMGPNVKIIDSKSVEDTVFDIYDDISRDDLDAVDKVIEELNVQKKTKHLRKEFRIASEGKSGIEKNKALRGIISRNSDKFDEEHLKEVAKEFGWGDIDFRIKSNGLIQLQDIPQEHREYVDSRDEAPEDVQVFEGDNEGLYYDTREVESRDEVDGEQTTDPENISIDDVDLENVSSEVRSIKQEWEAENESIDVERIFGFGSVMRGEAIPGKSDLDIMITTSNPNGEELTPEFDASRRNLENYYEENSDRLLESTNVDGIEDVDVLTELPRNSAIRLADKLSDDNGNLYYSAVDMETENYILPEDLKKTSKQDVPYEHRQYVDSRDDAPNNVQVYEGEQDDALYYDIRDVEEEEEEEYRSKNSLFEELEERMEDLSGLQRAHEANDFIAENILKSDPKDLEEVVGEFVRWDDRDFEVAAKSALHEHTEVGEDSSLNKPVTYEDYDNIEEEFRREYSGKSYFKKKPALKSWVEGELVSSSTAPMLQVAAEITDNNNFYSREDNVIEEVLEEDVTEEQKQAIKDNMEFDREKIKEKFGEEIPVFRGLSTGVAMWEDEDEMDIEDIEGIVSSVEDGGDIEMEHSCAESWSTNPVEAVRFAGDEGVIIQDWMKVDEVLASANSDSAFVPDQAEYIRLHENDSQIYRNGEEIFPSKDVTALSITQSAIQMWNQRENRQKSKQSLDVFVSGEVNQSGWLRQLRQEYDYEDESVEKQDIPREHREYVDSRDEAPDDVQVREGDQDGLYYDTRETEETEEVVDPPDIDNVSDLRSNFEIDKWRQINRGYSTEELESYYESQEYGGRKVLVQNLLYYRDDSDVNIDDVVPFNDAGTSENTDIDTVKEQTSTTLDSLEPAMGAFIGRHIGEIVVRQSRYAGQTIDGKYIDIDTDDPKTVAHEIGHVVQDMFDIKGGKHENDTDKHPSNWTFGIFAGRNAPEEGQEFVETVEEFWDEKVERKKKDVEELTEEEEEFEINEISSYQWTNGSEFISEMFGNWVFRYPDLEFVYPDVAEYLNEKFNSGERPGDEERW